ncbi:hypothetical protein, partial [Mariniblastus fucicola]
DPAYRRRRIIMQNMRDEELAIAQVEEMQAVSAVLRIRNHVIAVSCVKLLSAHNSTQHTSRKHKV